MVASSDSDRQLPVRDVEESTSDAPGSEARWVRQLGDPIVVETGGRRGRTAPVERRGEAGRRRGSLQGVSPPRDVHSWLPDREMSCLRGVGTEVVG